MEINMWCKIVFFFPVRERSIYRACLTPSSSSCPQLSPSTAARPPTCSNCCCTSLPWCSYYSDTSGSALHQTWPRPAWGKMYQLTTPTKQEPELPWRFCCVYWASRYLLLRETCSMRQPRSLCIQRCTVCGIFSLIWISGISTRNVFISFIYSKCRHMHVYILHIRSAKTKCVTKKITILTNSILIKVIVMLLF